jgi:hypothetical protein
LGEYLRRAINKATGVHTAPWVMPNYRPIFPPAEPETASAKLDAHGGVVFRYPVRDVGDPPASPASPGAAGTMGLPDAPQGVVHRADESPIQPAANGRALPPDRVLYKVAPVDRFASEMTDQISRADERAPDPAELSLFSPNTVADDEKSAVRARPLVAEPVVTHEIEPPRRDRPELGEEIQVSPPPPAVPNDRRAATDETVVQVHIGRIEVRMAAPAPSPARPKGPRGFAEYESIRRYNTRNRP